MKFSVAHARGANGTWLDMDMPEPVTVAEALRASRLFDLYPDLDLDTHKVGVFGKSCPLTTEVKEGDRVEIYLPIQRPLDNDEDEDD